MPFLAWALTGDGRDANKVAEVSALAQPAFVKGFARLAVKDCDYPAVIRRESSSVNGFLLRLETGSQRKKLDDFEGELYKVTTVDVHLVEDGKQGQVTVEADMYLWDGEKDALDSEPWDSDGFIKDRLEDWLDLFEGMELTGDD